MIFKTVQYPHCLTTKQMRYALTHLNYLVKLVLHLSKKDSRLLLYFSSNQKTIKTEKKWMTSLIKAYRYQIKLKILVHHQVAEKTTIIMVKVDTILTSVHNIYKQLKDVMLQLTPLKLHLMWFQVVALVDH